MLLEFNQQSIIPGIANAPAPLSVEAARVQSVLKSAFGEAPAADITSQLQT